MLKHSCIINIVPRLSLLYPHPPPHLVVEGTRQAKARQSLGTRLMHHTESSDSVTKRVMGQPSDHVIDFNQLWSKRNCGWVIQFCKE